MTHWANCTTQAGLLCHENSFVLLHVFHSYTKSLVDKVSCGETNPPLRIWIVLLVEGRKDTCQFSRNECRPLPLLQMLHDNQGKKQKRTALRVKQEKEQLSGGPGTDQASCEPVIALARPWLHTAHTASFGSFHGVMHKLTAINIGLSNLDGMFIGRVAHQLFQIADSISQRALGEMVRESGWQMMNLRSSKLEVKAFGHQGWARCCADSPAIDGPSLLGFPPAIRGYQKMISFWNKCLTLRLPVVHESKPLTCLSSQTWTSWVSKQDSTDITWLLVGLSLD